MPAGDSSFTDSCGHWLRPRERHQTCYLFIFVSCHNVNFKGSHGATCEFKHDLFLDSIPKEYFFSPAFIL